MHEMMTLVTLDAGIAKRGICCLVILISYPHLLFEHEYVYKHRTCQRNQNPTYPAGYQVGKECIFPCICKDTRDATLGSRIILFSR